MNAGVPVTGVGCICAAGPDLDACMATLFATPPPPGPPLRFRTSHSSPAPVFQVRDFQGDPGLLRTSALGLAAARQALADAGLEVADLAGLRVGVCMGTTVASAMSDETFCRDYRAGREPDLEPMLRILRSNPAEILARAFGCMGPVQTIVNACASGTDAIGIGAAWIRHGLCDLVLAGGADELGRMTYDGFIALKVTDEGPCRPFDRDRRGLNLGEGAAVLVLEAQARRRPARAFVLGYGSACDAHHQTAPSPDGGGLRRALAAALAEAGATPAEVAFVNAHGTGTADNDRVEGQVLARDFPGVPFLSTKGATGHALGAAGALEAAFTLASLEQGRIPASPGFRDEDPEIGASPLRAAADCRGRLALSQSLAFGGNNAVLALGAGARP